MSDWTKFDNIKVEHVETTNYEDVPVGRYAVSIEKLECKESKAGNPMLSVWFNIEAGEFANKKLFMNQVLLLRDDNDKYRIHTANEFLRSLRVFPEEEIEFVNMSDYANLIADIAAEINKDWQYELIYGENKKGYKTYEIVDTLS